MSLANAVPLGLILARGQSRAAYRGKWGFMRRQSAEHDLVVVVTMLVLVLVLAEILLLE